MYLFSSNLELSAAFPDGVPSGLLVGITGIGLVEAAVGTARCIAQSSPERIVFCGTCGAYPQSGLKTGDIIVAGSVSLGSGDVISGAMRLPSLMSATLDTDPELTQSLIAVSSATIVHVLCTLGITENNELASALGTQGAVENLEAFPVVHAAGTLPVAVVLGVTNIVGEGGGEQWRANFRPVMQKLVAAVMVDGL